MKLLTGILCGMLLAVSCGDDGNPAPTGPSTPTETLTPVATPTPMSAILPAERDVYAVVRQLAPANPGLEALIELVEGEQVDSLLRLFRRDAVLCEDEVYRAGDACTIFGVPRGTELEFVRVGEGPGGRVLLALAEEQFIQDLTGRRPQLELVAREGAEAIILIFDLDDPDIGQFRVRYEPATRVVTQAWSRTNVMPLDFIRVEEVGGDDVYEVLAAADSFHEKEAAFIEESRANNTSLPYDYQ